MAIDFDRVSWRVTLPDGSVRQIETVNSDTWALRALRVADGKWIAPHGDKWPGYVASLRALGFKIDTRKRDGRFQCRLACVADVAGAA